MTDTAVILAGGRSSRFGTPKALVRINGKSLIENIIEQIKQSGLAKIIISTNNPEIFSHLDLECIADEYSDSGPLAGIHSVLKNTNADSILVLSCDMPNITSNELKLILEKADISEKPLVYASTCEREHPLCGVYKSSLLNAMTKSLETKNLSVLDFCHQTDSEIAYFENETPFLNLNTPDDLTDEKTIPLDYELSFERPVKRYHRARGFTDMDDPVVRESFIRVWVNDDEIAVINALKKNVEYLAVGFLYNECLINDLTAITSIEFNDKLDTVTVNTTENTPSMHSPLVRTVSPGCGQIYFSIGPNYADYFADISSDVIIHPDKIIDLMNSLLKASANFQTTGGVHTSAISDGVKIINVVDDIGRHNSIDKILGRELMNHEIDPAKRTILTSGRISTDIITKAIRCHIPFLISHSAPSDGAVQLAQKYNITLIGFTRGVRFNIYTHYERVEGAVK